VAPTPAIDSTGSTRGLTHMEAAIRPKSPSESHPDDRVNVTNSPFAHGSGPSKVSAARLLPWERPRNEYASFS